MWVSGGASNRRTECCVTVGYADPFALSLTMIGSEVTVKIGVM